MKNNMTSANNLVYHRDSEDSKSGLRLARQDGSGRWRKLNAAVPIDPVELQKLLDEGNCMVPEQCVDIDRSEHLRRPGGPLVAPQCKSRLV
eukprot:7645097-Pyramimonas_sp.AAC.1